MYEKCLKKVEKIKRMKKKHRQSLYCFKKYKIFYGTKNRNKDKKNGIKSVQIVDPSLTAKLHMKSINPILGNSAFVWLSGLMKRAALCNSHRIKSIHHPISRIHLTNLKPSKLIE